MAGCWGLDDRPNHVNPYCDIFSKHLPVRTNSNTLSIYCFMKSFRSYMMKLDRQATAQPRKFDRKKLFRSILATTFVAGSQFVSAISATANPVPTPAAPSTILPNRSLFNGNFAQPTVTGWTGAPSLSSTIGADPNSNSNIAGANVREAYNEKAANPNADSIIWRSTESENNRPNPDPESSCNIKEYTAANGTKFNSRRAPVCFVDAIEVWRGTPTGNGSPQKLPANTTGLADTGKQYAELNGSDNAALYQDICVMPSETVGWSLYHAARAWDSSNPTNIMQVSITDPAGWVGKTAPVAQANAYYSSLGDYSTSGTYPGTKKTTGADTITSARPFIATKYNDGWKAYNGNWMSTNTTPKLMRFAFGAVQGSYGNRTVGNFITGVNLNLSPLIEFLPSDGDRGVNISTTTEGNPSNPNYYYLSLRVNGQMPAGQVQISLSGLTQRSFRLGNVLKGNATATGLTASATPTTSGGVITLNIPAGTYNPNEPSDYIHIPIEFSDLITQPNNNLTFTLDNIVGGNVTVGSSECGAMRSTIQTTLIDDDSQRRVELPVRVAAH
jgi:hypothetical protein